MVRIYSELIIIMSHTFYDLNIEKTVVFVAAANLTKLTISLGRHNTCFYIYTFSNLLVLYNMTL